MNKPSELILQWHITERCNWACKHCYQDKDRSSEVSFETMVNYFKQFLYCIEKWRIPKENACLQITGGEPFLRKDFLDLLQVINRYSHKLHVVILSNGSFLDRALIRKLKAMNVFQFQVSLEGTKEYNDSIRGKGSFKQVLNSVKLLAEEGIHTAVSMTVTRDNTNQVPALANILYSAGAKTLNTRRFIPLGRGKESKEKLLQPYELRDYYLKVLRANKIMQREKKDFKIGLGCESSIVYQEVKDKSQLTCSGSCAIITGRIVTLMPDGTLYPCRRLPITIGNLNHQNLHDLWNSQYLNDIRNPSNAHAFCRSCDNFSYCLGGAKCVTYAYSGDLFIPDVQCWKYRKNHPHYK